MCYELDRVVQIVAVAFSVLCVHGVVNAATVTMSPLSSSSSSPQLKPVNISVLHTEVADGARQLVEHNFLFGIASLGALYENNTQCGQELDIMMNAMAKKEVWGVKVQDSFGSPPKSFNWGNYFWFGTPALCDDINEPFNISLSHSRPAIFNASSPFPLNFIVVYLNFTTPYYIDLKLPYDIFIHLGLCVPKSCSVSKIKTYTDAYFQQEHFEMQRNYKLKMKAVHAKAPHFSWKYFDETGSILTLTVLITSTVLVIAAEINYKNSIANSHSTSTQYNPKKSSLWHELLMCFRFSHNWKTVISLENSKSHSKFLTVMAGMRTIICLWITVFHVYYYSLFAMSNTPFIFAKLESFALQPVQQAVFYVDVFFIMSSFLLVNNFLSNAKQIQRIRMQSCWGNLKLFLRSVAQRYMRLTPVMICTMLIGTMVFDFLNMYSPFHLAENSGLHCKNNWWYNLLYIQNLIDINHICCSWTWYLACEMQYFILFTGLLFLYAKKPIAAKIVFVTLSLGFVVVSWMCYFARGITFEIDVIYSTVNQLYTKPWTRISPYLGGAAMGWLMHTLQQRQQNQLQRMAEQHEYITTDTHQTQHQHQHHHHHHQRHHDNQHLLQRECVGTIGRAVFWLFCLVLYVTTNFMSYWHSTPSWMVATIMSIGKFVFALCVGGVIIMCACGRGGRLNELLSARPLLLLNKFCFSIYMLAPLIVIAMFGLRNEPTNFTEVASGSDFISSVVLSIMSAFLAMMLVELPMQGIANRLLREKNS